MPKPKVNWYADKVVVAALEAVNLPAIALQIEGQAKANIVENDQIDTGFMLNSVYSTGPEGSTYGAAKSEASKKNPAGGMAPEVDPQGGAAVAVGAEYSIFQEMRESFLYRAAELVASQIQGVIKTL